MNEKSDDPSDKADAEKKDAEEKSSEETAKQADETTAKETLVTPTKEITGVEVLKMMELLMECSRSQMQRVP